MLSNNSCRKEEGKKIYKVTSWEQKRQSITKRKRETAITGNRKRDGRIKVTEICEPSTLFFFFRIRRKLVDSKQNNNNNNEEQIAGWMKHIVCVCI